MKQTIFTIRSNEALTDSVYRMVLEGDTSAITAPGQFVNIHSQAGFSYGLEIMAHLWYPVYGRAVRAGQVN